MASFYITAALVTVFSYIFLDVGRAASYPVTVGGSSAIRTIIDAQVSKQSYIRYKGGAYLSSNSLDGVNRFKAGTYDIAVSTVPFTAKQETGYANKKLTIPHGIFSLSPFHSKVSGIKLTPAQIADIFLGKIKTWETVTKNTKGTIIPVLRKDPAGVVQIFTSFLQKAVPSWPAKYVGDGPYTFGNSKAITADKAGGVAALLAKTTGGFGFGQSGVYSNKPYNLKEIAVRNRAGIFVTITGAKPADVQASLPRTPPGAYQSWSGVNLVWQPGPQTYPAVSLAYVFYKSKYTPKAKRDAIVNFGLFAQTSAGQALLTDLQFYVLPNTYRSASSKALKTITS